MSNPSPALAPVRSPPPQVLTSGLTVLLAVSVGLVVANLYYIQPLMGEIARGYNVPDATIGHAVTMGQAGLAFGTLTILPLGDVSDRRKLIIWSCVGSALSLILMAFAPDAIIFLAANFLLGFTSIATHLQISYAAHIASPEKRGHAVGAVMSGLLVGIIIARTISGFLGAWYGWRFVLFVAAAATFALAFVMRLVLPRDYVTHSFRYGELLASMPRLYSTQPVLRSSCIYGALSFAIFNAVWATLTFYLESPVFRMDSQSIGLFGLVAISGAIIANLAGRLTTLVKPVSIIAFALIILVAAFGVMLGWGATVAGMVMGMVMMDIGVQATHVGNQTRVHNLNPAMRNRLHTLYMVTYFIGGSVGSALGTWSYSRWSWPGLCFTCISLASTALLFWWMRRWADSKKPG